MKKILVTIAIVSLGLTTFATAHSTIDPKIIAAFEKEFSFAKNVKWEIKQELAQVNFLLNEQAVTAWYNSDAVLVALARNLLYGQLPISVIKVLDKNYADAALFGIMEVMHNNEVHYQLTAETKRKTLLLKVTPAGNITIKKRIK
ncbi:MAG TPA: hypothetical protein VFP97_04545 [Chitinophagaceae bacterium]|nr:hypothetical protein [Chitinophagaceae bacterium]